MSVSHWLGVHGLPPTIPEWDGWYNPTVEDVGQVHMLRAMEEDHDHYCLDDSRDWLLVGEDPYFNQLFARRAANDPTVEWEPSARLTTKDEEMGEPTTAPFTTDALPFAEGMDLDEATDYQPPLQPVSQPRSPLPLPASPPSA
jgi:hypothetical protein